MNQPLFIYGDYPAGATVALIGNVAGQTGSDVLQANEDTYVSPVSTTITLTIDLLSPVALGCVALAGENLNGVTMQLRFSTDNFAASSFSIASSSLAGFTAVWRAISPPMTYRYLRIELTGATAATRIYHVAAMPQRLLPYLDDGADLDAFIATTNHIISPQGHFLGTQKIKAERKIPLSWGQIADADYPAFCAWAAACVLKPQAHFFVPDSAGTACYFGYADQGYTFSAPVKLGLRSIPKINFTSRYA